MRWWEAVEGGEGGEAHGRDVKDSRSFISAAEANASLSIATRQLPSTFP